MTTAKELFFNYLGSRFFMDRDGDALLYESFKISKEQESEWLRELTNTKISALDKKGNWQTVFFLEHHSNFNFFDEILNAEPLGLYWEICAYLELLFSLMQRAQISKSEKQRVLNYISEKGNLILQKAKHPERITSLLDKNKNRK